MVRTIVAVGLIVLGLLALVYGGFSYTRETHDIDLGPIEFEVEEKERVNVPVWAGVAGVVAGTGLLLVGRKRRP